MNEYTYEVITDEKTGEEVIKRTDSNGVESWIPRNPANRDYAEYLASLETAE